MRIGQVDIISIMLDTIKEFKTKNCVSCGHWKIWIAQTSYCLHQEVVWGRYDWHVDDFTLVNQFAVLEETVVAFVSHWGFGSISGNSHCYSCSCNANDVGKWSSATESFVLALVTMRLQLMLKWQSSWEKCPPSCRDLLLLLIGWR